MWHFQAALYYRVKMGFQSHAYKGLETGERKIVSHAVKQNDVRGFPSVFSLPIFTGSFARRCDRYNIEPRLFLGRFFKS